MSEVVLSLMSVTSKVASSVVTPITGYETPFKNSSALVVLPGNPVPVTVTSSF
jgi:hypothetical protein